MTTELIIFMPVKVFKGTDVNIANPITLRITPLTVEQALERNLISSGICYLPAISFISPNRASKEIIINTNINSVIRPYKIYY